MDTNPFKNLKSYQDYAQAEQEFQLKKTLAAAQLAKANELDLDKVGETAFAKLSQGIPLSPLEHAGAQFLQNKSGGIQFDPLTNNMIQKPKLFDGLNFEGAQPAQQPAQQPARQPTINPRGNFATNTQPAVNAGASGDFLADVAPSGAPAPSVPTANPLEQKIADEANRQRRAAGNDRKLLQRITEEENAAKLKLISDSENKTKAEAERYSKALESTGLTELVGAAERANNAIPATGDIPGFGAYGAGSVPDFMTSQAGVDTRQQIAGLKNAILKARSGGAVTPGEADRMMTELGSGLGRSDDNLRTGISNVTQMLQERLTNAGGGYSPEAKKMYLDNGGTISTDRLAKFTKPPQFKKGEADFHAQKIATPEEIAEYKKLRGIK